MIVINNNNYENNHIIYKLSDGYRSYIGKCNIPLYMRLNIHKHSTKLEADKYFSKDWSSVTCEVLDYSIDKKRLLELEKDHIRSEMLSNPDKILNVYNTKIKNI